MVVLGMLLEGDLAWGVGLAVCWILVGELRTEGEAVGWRWNS